MPILGSAMCHNARSIYNYGPKMKRNHKAASSLYDEAGGDDDVPRCASGGQSRSSLPCIYDNWRKIFITYWLEGGRRRGFTVTGRGQRSHVIYTKTHCIRMRLSFSVSPREDALRVIDCFSETWPAGVEICIRKRVKSAKTCIRWATSSTRFYYFLGRDKKVTDWEIYIEWRLVFVLGFMTLLFCCFP
jgi:hypothetical protein